MGSTSTQPNSVIIDNTHYVPPAKDKYTFNVSTLESISKYYEES